MVDVNNHPTIKRYNERKLLAESNVRNSKLNAVQLGEMCLELGADDVGLVNISHPALANQKADILKVFPWTKTLISFVGRLNRENLRSPACSIASLELQQVEERLNHVAHTLAASLDRKGIRAVALAAGFPMETLPPGNMKVVSHKPIAEAAGLGKMGLHRNIIHPEFGSFVLLNTVLIDAPSE